MSLLYLAILFGVISTVQLHIAKAMERQGIEVFDQIRAKLGKSHDASVDIEGGVKKPLIYVVGLVLNNTIIFYPMLANMYGPPALYTSMFGTGLVALMLYSKFVLKEPISRLEYLGAFTIVAGTVTIGVESIFQPELDLALANVQLMFSIAAVFILIFSVFMAMSLKTGKMTGLTFGLLAGGCGGLDPVIKSVGQSIGAEQTGFLPSSVAGWLVFLVSFAVSTVAFLVTQWGFAKKARASVLVPAYNTSYIVLPIVVQSMILSAYVPGVVTWVGVALTIGGIVLMQAFKESPTKAVGSLAVAGEGAPREAGNGGAGVQGAEGGGGGGGADSSLPQLP
ncbi:MAG: hypothetical protein ACTSU5_11000 [Promethearchaeota archaeon]